MEKYIIKKGEQYVRDFEKTETGTNTEYTRQKQSAKEFDSEEDFQDYKKEVKDLTTIEKIYIWPESEDNN